MKYLFLLLMSCTILSATDRFYSNKNNTSDNGDFTVNAESPDNAIENPRPWQSKFVITLTNNKTKKTIWTIKQGDNDSQPTFVRVSNLGTTIIRDAWDNVWKVGLNGQKIAVWDVLKLIGKEKITKYCDNTTAGIFWSQFSIMDFTTVQNEEYFYIRLYWGDYLIHNINENKFDYNAVQENIELTNAIKYNRIITEAKVNSEKCSSCNGNHFKHDLKVGVFVLKNNKIPVKNSIVLEVIKGYDGSSETVSEYYDR